MRKAARNYLQRLTQSVKRAFASAGMRAPQPPGWIDVEQLRLFWFIQTHHDLPRLTTTLAALRALYPESPKLIVSDGDDDPQIPVACRRYGADFHFADRLMAVEKGGEPVQQMLAAFLATDADVLIKIDPDTHLRRRFTTMPPPGDTSIYGTVQTAGSESRTLTSIQGGCIIVPRAAAVVLTTSSLLLSERLKPPALEWAVGEESRARARSGLTSHDWTLGWACRQLGIETADHPEVFSRYRPSLIDAIAEGRVAVSHPRFDIRQLWQCNFFFPGLRMAIREALSGGPGGDADRPLR